MKTDPHYVMGNRPQRWSMKVSFKERDLLLFPINPLPVSVRNLNSSFPTRLPDYFQSCFFRQYRTFHVTLFLFISLLYSHYCMTLHDAKAQIT
jgi:hypothetical protein